MQDFIKQLFILRPQKLSETTHNYTLNTHSDSVMHQYNISASYVLLFSDDGSDLRVLGQWQARKGDL